MSAPDVARLRHLLENRTPGVWKLWGMTVMSDQDGSGDANNAVTVAHTAYRDEHGKPRTWDASLIAEGIKALPALLDEIEALREALHIGAELDNHHNADTCPYCTGGIRARADAAEAREIVLRDLLREATAHEDGPCRLDHHGDCQDHDYSAPCVIPRARAALGGAFPVPCCHGPVHHHD